MRGIPDEVLDGFAFPWPLCFPITRVEDINAHNVEAFVMHPHRPGMEGKTRKLRLRAELLRWHPDKFQAVVLGKVVPTERENIKELAVTVAQILTQLMAR
ncbi:hypothetical protein OF83DRAFT_1053111 [Amylostereum chailletii]|nr:hypothetical protein OF83DRAFT_1053111 [Amylostereum chailletii]